MGDKSGVLYKALMNERGAYLNRERTHTYAFIWGYLHDDYEFVSK
jgi:hypothetical protein